MATNRRYEAPVKLPIAASHPTTPSSGQPCRVGNLTGVSLIDENSNYSNKTTIDTTESVYELPVKGSDGSGNGAVAIGDALYYVDANIGSGNGFLNKDSSGYFFGYALEAVNSGATVSIDVFHCNAPSNIGGTGGIVSGNEEAGDMLVHYFLLPAGANADLDIEMNHPLRVTGAKVVLKGAGTTGCLVTVKNTATAITNAINVAAGADKAVFVDSTIDDATQDVPADGVLRVSKASTGGDFPGAEVYVFGFRTA